MTRPNLLTDELSDDAKAELAAIFADMERRYDTRDDQIGLGGRPAWLKGYDRPHERRRGW